MKYFLFTFVFICAFWNIEVQSSADNDFIQKSIASSRVVIFSKSYCSFSKLAKKQFDKLNCTYKAIELDQRSDGDNILKALGKLTGDDTVPRVFIDGAFVGGGSDMETMYEDGTLKETLDDEADE